MRNHIESITSTHGMTKKELDALIKKGLKTVRDAQKQKKDD